MLYWQKIFFKIFSEAETAVTKIYATWWLLLRCPASLWEPRERTKKYVKENDAGFTLCTVWVLFFGYVSSCIPSLCNGFLKEIMKSLPIFYRIGICCLRVSPFVYRLRIQLVTEMFQDAFNLHDTCKLQYNASFFDASFQFTSFLLQFITMFVSHCSLPNKAPSC